jgi:UDP-3-O-[3-hydroxymyristoyl] N-acetylglucosamine deacetylase
MVNVAEACVSIEDVDRSRQAAGMQHRRQRTLKNPIHCAGIGLNSGQKVELVLKPAEPGHGIVFCRTDVASPGEPIPARWEHAAEDLHSVVLVKDGGPRISGTAQILSAAGAAGLDNLLIEVQGSEIPILDGSAEPFLFLLRCAGTTEQEEATRAIKILQAVEIKERGKSVRLEPHDTFAVEVEIAHAHPAIGRQRWTGEITIERYHAELARARSFGFQREIESLQAQGLAIGSNLEHGVILGEEGVLNEGGWRYPDEAVRHAALVSIGDLRMAGGPIIGRFRGVNCEHSMIISLLRKLFETPDSWEWTEYSGERVKARMDPAA